MHTEHLSGRGRMVEIYRCGRAGAVGEGIVATAADEVQASGNSSRATGGAWARRVGSGSARNPRCSRIFLATSGSSMQAMSRMVPQQREHFRTSTPKTRFSSAAQSRRYVDGTDVDGTDVDFGDAAGGAPGMGAEQEVSVL